MKPLRLLSVLGLSLLLLYTSGCGGGNEEGSAASSANGSLAVSSQPATSAVAAASGEASASEVSSASASGAAGEAASEVSSGAESEAAPSAPAAPTEMAGLFLHLDEARYTAERAPQLELENGGSYKLRLNTGEGISQITGSYQRNGASLTLSVATRESEDFLGAELSELPFSVLDEDHLEYTGEALGLVRSGDQFTRNGVPPVEKAASAPAASSESASATSEPGAAAGEAASAVVSASTAE